MTTLMSEKVEQVPISDIIWPERQRTTYDPIKLEQLADSIAMIGLNQPILLDDNNRLIAGGRRIKAHEQLGRTHIEAVRKSDLAEWELVAIELAENIYREDLTYADEVAAKAKLHKLYQDQHGYHKTLGGQDAKSRPKWRLEDTAKLISTSTGALSQDLELAKAIDANPDLGKFKLKSQAVSALRRNQEQTVRGVLAAVAMRSDTPPSDQNSTSVSDTPNQGSTPVIPSFTHNLATVYNAPCSDIIDFFVDSSVSAIITDPPWQVKYDETFGTESDVGLSLTEDFLTKVKPKLAPAFQGWLFCASKHLIKGTIYNLLHDLGYHVAPQFYIWYKPHIATTSRPYNELKNDYEPAVWFSTHPIRTLSKPVYAINSATITIRHHTAQKPAKIISQLIDLSTVQAELILDPFCGSGVVGHCANLLGRRSVLIEKDPTHYSTACGVIAQTLTLDPPSEAQDG